MLVSRLAVGTSVHITSPCDPGPFLGETWVPGTAGCGEVLEGNPWAFGSVASFTAVPTGWVSGKAKGVQRCRNRDKQLSVGTCEMGVNGDHARLL